MSVRSGIAVLLLPMAGVCAAAVLDLPPIPSGAKRREEIFSPPTVLGRIGPSVAWIPSPEMVVGVEGLAFEADFDLPDIPFAVDSILEVDLQDEEMPDGSACAVEIGLVPEGMPDAPMLNLALLDSGLSDFVLRGFDAIRIGKMIDRQMLAGLADGTLSPRLPQWRPRLLAMLVRGGPLDFDAAFDLLLGTFSGADYDERLSALGLWADGLVGREAADVYRAETRYWLRVGDSARAVDAANRMEVAYPGYRVRACRLRAVAYANEGAFARARAALTAAGAESPSPSEQAELLYVGAWIDLQDGREDEARRALLDVVSRWPGEPVADRARRVLSTLAQEVDE